MLYTLFKYLLFRPVCRFGFRPTVEGEENIPASGGAVLAANHTSAGETFLLPAMIRRRVTFPAKAELFTGHNLPTHIVAWFLKAVGQVPMDRSGGRASAMGLEPVMEVLRAGGLVGIFPEGTRSRDGRLYRGRTGVARLALAAQVPVIRVGFYGTDFRRGPCGIPTMHRPVIRIGRPIRLDDYVGTDPDGSVYRKVTDQVMAQIQRLTGQEYVDAYGGTTRAAKLVAGDQPAPTAEPASDDSATKPVR